MSRNLIFLVLYVALGNTVDALVLNVLFVMHCAFNLVGNISKKRGIQFMDAYYIGASISTLANISYLNKIALHGVSRSDLYFYIVLDYVQSASMIWTIGNTCMFIGYDVVRNRSFPTIRVDISNEAILDRIFQTVVVIGILSFTGNAINLSAITGGLQKVISLLNLMGIMYFARLWIARNNMKYRNYAIILCILQTLIALYTSFLRLDLLTPIISFAGGYFIGKGSVRHLFSVRLVPFLVILAIFASFFNTLGGNRAHFITAFTEQAVVDNNSYVVTSDEGEERGGVFERSSNVAQLSNVVNLVERNGLYGGRASLPLVAALIPRFLWPDKPQIQLGAWFAFEIGAGTLTAEGIVNNSVNMTIPGELFLDFGWIGLVVGSLIFGIFMAMFWNVAEFNSSPYNLTGALWGGYLLLYGLIGIGADLQILISLISTYIVFLILKNIFAQYASVLSRPAVAR